MYEIPPTTRYFHQQAFQSDVLRKRELYDEWYRKGEFEYTNGGNVSHETMFYRLNKWIADAWKRIDSKILKKLFEACGITTSDFTKIHCLNEGQLIEEARVLLGKSDENLELIAKSSTRR